MAGWCNHPATHNSSSITQAQPHIQCMQRAQSLDSPRAAAQVTLELTARCC